MTRSGGSRGRPSSAEHGAAEEQFLTLTEIVSAARRRLDDPIWDFFDGGAETETTLRRNRQALDALALRPRILRDVTSRTAATRSLDQTLSAPVMIAPIGVLMDVDPAGSIAVARAAERAGTVGFISINSAPTLDEVRAAAPNAALVFQAYVFGDSRLRRLAIELAENAGCIALCLTVDSHVYGRRERDLIRRYDGARLRAHPNFSGLKWSDHERAAASWDDLARTRDETTLPIIVKGVQTSEDAEQALEHGVDVIYVSNHGGRQLDHGRGTMEVLPEIVAAVAGRAPVLFDGGIRHGTDVIKAMAAGAQAVLIGRLAAWGLAAGGEHTLVRALSILREEIETTMGQLGISSLSELGPAFLASASAVHPAYAMGNPSSA